MAVKGTLREDSCCGGVVKSIGEKNQEFEPSGATVISERHRHRYEVNNDYRDILSNSGLTLSGISPDGKLVETAELSDMLFYLGVQFHPEFKSRPNRPHPLFIGFIQASLNSKNQ